MDLRTTAKSAAVEGVSWLIARLRTDKPVESIDDIRLDDLKREKIRLDQEEAKLMRRVEELEGEKQALFLKGKDEPSRRKKTVLARKIKELDGQAKNYDRTLAVLSQQIRIINGFVQLKENETLLKSAGISKLIYGMDLQTLQLYIERATVDGAFQMDKFSEILGVLEEREELVGGVRADEDIEEIVKAMEEAAELEAERPTAVEEGLRKVDEILTTEEAEEEPF